MIFLSVILAKENFPRCYSPVALSVETFLLFTGDRNGKKEERERGEERKHRMKETRREATAVWTSTAASQPAPASRLLYLLLLHSSWNSLVSPRIYTDYAQRERKRLRISFSGCSVAVETKLFSSFVPSLLPSFLPSTFTKSDQAPLRCLERGKKISVSTPEPKPRVLDREERENLERIKYKTLRNFGKFQSEEAKSLKK